MKNKITYLPIGILTVTTALAGVALSSSEVAADTSGSKTAAVTVGTSCTFTGSTTYSESLSLYAGSLVESSTSRSPYTITCNNSSGFLVKAVGNSPDSTHPSGNEGNTGMYNSTADVTIPTGTSGSDSYWSFKIGFAYASTGTYEVASGYNTYHTIPNEATTVVSYGSSSSIMMIGMFRPDYQVYAKMAQTAGSYVGSVKYTIVQNA